MALLCVRLLLAAGSVAAASNVSFDAGRQRVLSIAISAATRNRRVFNLSSNARPSTPAPELSLVSTLCGDDPLLNLRIGCCKPSDTRYLSVERQGRARTASRVRRAGGAVRVSGYADLARRGARVVLGLSVRPRQGDVGGSAL